MTKIFLGNALWQLTLQSDFVTKLVLLSLLCLSIICWALFLYKLILMRLKKHHLTQALAMLDDVKNVDQLIGSITVLSGTVPGHFFSKNLTLIKECLQKNRQGEKQILTVEDIELVREQAYSTIDELVYREESGLTFLSTSAAISPLLGLFGTIWGLIHAFVRISEKQSADITTVAPGLAEALITTLAGLMVAIPALAMYNYLISQAGVIEQRLTVLASRFIIIAQRLFC